MISRSIAGSDRGLRRVAHNAAGMDRGSRSRSRAGRGSRRDGKVRREGDVVLGGAGLGVEASRAAEVLDKAERSAGTAPFAVTASLAESWVDAEAGLQIGLRHALDVARAESLGTVGTLSSRLIGVEGLALVDASVWGEHVVGFDEPEGGGHGEDDEAAHFGGVAVVWIEMEEVDVDRV